jgi:hypothetical protein
VPLFHFNPLGFDTHIEEDFIYDYENDNVYLEVEGVGNIIIKILYKHLYRILLLCMENEKWKGDKSQEGRRWILRDADKGIKE